MMVIEIDGIEFEWDEEKEKKNIRKHGVSFGIAARIFFDENLLQEYDPFHSDDEDRYFVIGAADNDGHLLILTASITERGERIRIISARKATKQERSIYYEQNSKNNS